MVTLMVTGTARGQLSFWGGQLSFKLDSRKWLSSFFFGTVLAY